MTLEHKPNSSYFIEIQPKMLDANWTGELDVNIITSSENPLPEESKAHMLHLCQLVASTVALMERRYATHGVYEIYGRKGEASYDTVWQ